jgi:hypothetical protein
MGLVIWDSAILSEIKLVVFIIPVRKPLSVSTLKSSRKDNNTNLSRYWEAVDLSSLQASAVNLSWGAAPSSLLAVVMEYPVKH